jgi:hypothetical protein
MLLEGFQTVRSDVVTKYFLGVLNSGPLLALHPSIAAVSTDGLVLHNDMIDSVD